MVGLLAGAAKGLMKKPKKVDPKKFAGKMEETKASSKPKGGALAIRDVESIVKVVDIKPKDAKVKAKGGPLAEIQEGVHSIVLALRDEQKAKKKRLVLKRKNQEKKKRLNLEALSELGKTAGNVAGGLASATGITSLWGAIWKTLGILFTGWLMNFLPQILGFVSKFIDIATKVIKVATPIFKAIWSTFTWITDKGFKLLAMVSGIKPEEALDNSIIKNFTEIQKRIPLLEAAFAWFAILQLRKSSKQPKSGGPKQPKRSIKNKIKRTNQKIKRFTDPKRTSKLNRVKNIKKIRADKLTRIKKFGRLRKIAKAKKAVNNITKPLTKTISKTTKVVSKGISKAKPLIAKTQGAVTKGLAKTQGAVTKGLAKTQGAVTKTSQAVGKNISKVSGKISQSAGKIVTRLGMKMNTGMVQSMKGLSKMAKGVRIPVVGPILAALTSYLADGKWDKALFIGLGTALGEMLGTAIPIPVLGTLLGGAIGYYIGDLLYTLFRGGGAKAVLNKLKEDLKKVFNVGEAIFDWSKMGLGRLWEGLPKVFGVPNPAWLFNPLNMVDKAKLIGKAFFSREPMVEEKEDEDKEEEKKLSKEFKIGKKTLDISKSMGGLTQDEWNDLTTGQRNQVNRRISTYADQNTGNDNIKGNATTKSNDASLISKSASYDDNGGKSTIIPVPIGEMQDGSSDGGKTLVSGDASVNKYETVNELKKSVVLSKHYSD